MCSQGPPNGTFESSYTNTHPFTDANLSSLSTRIAISLSEVKLVHRRVGPYIFPVSLMLACVVIYTQPLVLVTFVKKSG